MHLPDRADVSVARVGVGYGLESVVARIDVAISPGTITSYAVKLCPAGVARSERATYTSVLADTGVPHPELISATDDGEHGVVVTRYVPGRQGDVLDGCSELTALDLVSSIAALHAKWWQRVAPGVLPVADRLRRPLHDEQIERCLAEHGAVVDPAARAVWRSLPARIGGLVDLLDRHPRTVVHADLHLDNVIVDEFGRVTILDWGRPRAAPAAIDVARCLVEVADTRPDEPLGRRLIEHHVGRLRALGVRGYGSDDLRDAIELAQLLFVPGVIRWAASAAPAPGTRPWRLLRQLLGRLARATV